MKKYKKILLSIVLIIVLLIFSSFAFNFFCKKTPSEFSRKSNEIITYDEASDSFVLPQSYGMNISSDMLDGYSVETVQKLKSAAKSGTLSNREWHSITGYSAAAFLDRKYYRESVEINCDDDTFTLGFVGDICMVAGHPERDRVADYLDPVISDEMKNVNLLFANNEFVFSDRGEPIDMKLYNFRAAPEEISQIKDLGIDVLTLANNHTYDYGAEAFADTLDTIDKSGIYRVGAGMDFDEASKPVSFIINGYKVSCFSASSAEFPLFRQTVTAKDDRAGIMGAYSFGTALKEQIQKENTKSDFIIVYMHWGIERTTFLTPWQRLTARQYIRAGASAIVGSHPHVIQGIEFYHGSPIVYSLGNFWFDNAEASKRLFAEIEVTDDGFGLKLIPCIGYIRYPDADVRNDMFRYIVRISPWGRITINENGEVTERY